MVAVPALGLARAEPRVAVVGGTEAQRAMARWAVGRFRETGLDLPPLEIRFHEDREPCGGRAGFYLGGVVHVCRRNGLTDAWAARELLHEMAHGWLEARVVGEARERFVRMRGLTTWNDPDVAWDARGFEHGAEILAWAIGDQADGILMPSIPDNERPDLVRAYRVLTGRSLPSLEAADRWAGAGLAA
jgi:hypothetical protein